MGRKNRKVAIIGSGLVGSSCAYAMINQSICDEIVIVSRNHEHALAQALDLSHCADFTSTRTRVRAGHYADCADADIVVMTAGANVKAGQTRMDIIADAAAITREVTTSVMESGFDGIFVVAANPVDVVTHITAQVSGLPRHRVIGTGTSIDSARLKTLLADVFQVDPRSVHGYAMGEHGESQFVAWSHVTIGGKPILHIAEEHKLRFPNLDLQDIARKTKDAGWEIFTRKGSTQFGIGSAIAYITRSILNDDHRIIAVSAILDGEYDQRDVCVGVPAIIGADGIEELIEFNLSDEEKSSFERSCEIIRAGLDVVAQAPLVG